MEKIVVSCLESRIDEDQSIYSRFLLGPFLSGHAVTVATALRRALLSEVKNIAITALHIQGVTHEFSTLVGIRESVLEVSLNFQQIILSTKTKPKSVQIGYLHVQGPAIVHANDLKLPDGIECVNPTQYIATLSTEGLLVVKFLIGEKKSFLKSNTSTLNSKKIKEAKVYSAQLSKALLNHAEYDPPRLFRLLRNQSLPNGAIVRKTIEAESTSHFANLKRPNVRSLSRIDGTNRAVTFAPRKFGRFRLPPPARPPAFGEARRGEARGQSATAGRPNVTTRSVNLNLKEQNLVEPSLTKVEFLTGSGSAGGRNEAVGGAGPVDKKGSSKQIQKVSLSAYRPSHFRLSKVSKSVRSEAGVGLGDPKSLQPDLEQLSLALPFRESARSSSSAPITDSILDQLANQTSDEFNSEVCLRTIIPLDPIFTPVYQVNFGVERDDLSNQSRERVIMEVWTNGSIHPRQAINEAALSTMSIFSKLRKTFQLDSHSLALSANSTAPLASLTRGTRLHKTKSLTKRGVVNDDASESVEPLAALLSFANLNFRRTLTPRLASPKAGGRGYPERSSGYPPQGGSATTRVADRLTNVSEAKITLRGAKESRAAVRGARVAEGSKKRITFRRFALTKPSGTELDLTNSVRQKLNSFSSLGFVRSRHPVSLFLQNFGISHIRGQTFILEQSFWLKAKFFKGRTFTPLFGLPAAERSSATARLSACRPSDPPFGGVTITDQTFGNSHFCAAKVRNSSSSPKVSERDGAGRFVDSRKLELRAVFSKRRYTSENEPLSADTETKFRHTFKRTFLPSFKVVLGALSLSAYRPSHFRRTGRLAKVSKSATNRNDVSARRESLFSSLPQPNLKQNKTGLTKASLLFKLRFCLAGAQTFTLLQSKSESNFHKAKVWPVHRKLSLCESEAFKPFLRGSWCSETSCFSPSHGGKGNRSKDRAINQVSIGLGRLLLVLSKYEEKGEHRSRVQNSQTFALAKAVKAVALIRRAGISSSRSDLLSKKVSTLQEGSSTFILSKNRLSGRLSGVTSWPNLRPTGQTFAKRELLSLSAYRPSHFRLSKVSESVNVTDRIAQQSETRQFASSVSRIKQLKPKPILFLIKYRTFSFTRNAVRIFRSKQEDSLFLLPLAKQLIRVKLARVLTSYLPLISKRSEASLPFSFTETKAFTTVDGSNRVDVKQVLLSLAALAASRESDAGVSQTYGRQVTRPTKEDAGTSFRLHPPARPPAFGEARRGEARGQSSAVLGRTISKKVPKSLVSKRPKKSGRRRPMGRAEGGLENRAPQKRISSVIAVHTITPLDRNVVPVSRFTTSKLWFRSNLKKQFGFFQFACNGSRPGHQRDLVRNSRYKGVGWNRSGTRPRGLKKRWMPDLGPALPRRNLERSGVCVNRTESLANINRIGPVNSALLSRSESVGLRYQKVWREAPRSDTVPYDFTTFPLSCFAKVAKKRCFANLNFRRSRAVADPFGVRPRRHVRLAGPLAKGSKAKVLPLIMTKAPPLCLSSGLVTVLSSLGPTGRCSQNVAPANNSSANFGEGRVRPFQVVPQAGNPPKGGSDRETRVTEGGNRLSILYSSNLDKMSFLSSDLANLSLSLKTYTFLKKKGKNNIATLLEDSPNTLLSLLKGDENMFHEIERCLLFLGLPFKERS